MFTISNIMTFLLGLQNKDLFNLINLYALIFNAFSNIRLEETYLLMFLCLITYYAL